MIILKDVPFEQRARFLRDSLCGIPESVSFRAVMDQRAAGIAEGLRKLDGVLRALYSVVAHVEGKDDEARYASLIASMWARTSSSSSLHCPSTWRNASSAILGAIPTACESESRPSIVSSAPRDARVSNMARVDGVSLCTGGAEARRIYAAL